jgi:uncharacterized protein YbjT (DUF2867 family)
MTNTASSKPIAVFGATGAQGGPVVQALLKEGRPVRAVGRDTERLSALAERGAEVVSIDLDNQDSVRRALTGVSGAFLHLPFLPVHEIIEGWSRALAAALVDEQVPLAVFTLSGPPSTSPVGVASFDTKALAKGILSDADARIVAFEPTGYLGNLSAFFSAPSIVHENELRYPLPADHRQPWISVEDQAALVVAALDRPDLAGRWFRIGEQLTGPELATGIGDGLGRPVRYVALDPDAFGRSLAPVMGEEIGAALAHDYRMLGSRPAELALETDTTEIRELLGVQATPVAEWARTQDWKAAAAVLGTP